MGYWSIRIINLLVKNGHLMLIIEKNFLKIFHYQQNQKITYPHICLILRELLIRNSKTIQAAQKILGYLSQGHKRNGTFSQHVSMCRGVYIYSFELDRIITGNELLAIMGYPGPEMRSTDMFATQADLAKAVANGVFGPSIGISLAALVFNRYAEWWY